MEAATGIPSNGSLIFALIVWHRPPREFFLLYWALSSVGPCGACEVVSIRSFIAVTLRG